MIKHFKTYYCLFIILIVSCQTVEIPNNYVVVEKFNEKYLEDSLKNIPYNYYLGNNIIIPENSERIFYHDTKLLCGTDWEVNHPPLPINFDRNPLFAFSSIGEFSTFFKNYTSTPRLVLFVSDSDTIMNKKYFELVDTLKNMEQTHILARRKITNDELNAINNSKIINVDMQQKCNLDDLSVIQYNLMRDNNIEKQLDNFISLSKSHCQYHFEYDILYEKLLYQLILKTPEEFVNKCNSLENIEKRLGK